MVLATDILQAAGYTVLQATNAEKGIVMAETEQPSLILMDVGLPGMDGLTAVEILKRRPRTREIPVIALTAHAMKGDEEKALSAGCVSYITKPLDTRALPRSVATFRRRTAEEAAAERETVSERGQDG